MNRCQHATKIGLSDGSSVFAWKCQDCGVVLPKHATTRGKWRSILDNHSDDRDAEIRRLRAQVAALKQVMEAAEKARGAPMPVALMAIDAAIAAYNKEFPDDPR